MKWMSSTIALIVLSVTCLAAQDLFVRLPADPPVKNPLEGNLAAITAGMGAYRQRCADCHGMDARGIRVPRHHAGLGARPQRRRALRDRAPRYPGHRDAGPSGAAHVRHRYLADPRLPEDAGRARAFRAGAGQREPLGQVFSPPTASGATGSAIAEGTSDLTSRGSAPRARARRWRARFAATSPTSGPATSRSR